MNFLYHHYLINSISNEIKYLPSSFKNFEIGNCDKNSRVKFFSPKNPEHISCSIENIQNTKDFFITECKDLSTIMEDLNHKKIDILKMDIEGAEYNVLEDISSKNTNIKIFLIEFHGNNQKIIKYTLKLISNGIDFNKKGLNKNKIKKDNMLFLTH